MRASAKSAVATPSGRHPLAQLARRFQIWPPVEASGLDHGARAELAPAARSDYFALRAGIRQVTAQLQACQVWLR